MLGLQIAGTGLIFIVIALLFILLCVIGKKSPPDGVKAVFGFFFCGGAVSIIGGLLTSIWF